MTSTLEPTGSLQFHAHDRRWLCGLGMHCRVNRILCLLTMNILQTATFHIGALYFTLGSVMLTFLLMDTVMISVLSVLTMWTVGVLLLVAGYQQHRALLMPAAIIMVLTAASDYYSPVL